jgi:hypothetical protein
LEQTNGIIPQENPSTTGHCKYCQGVENSFFTITYFAQLRLKSRPHTTDTTHQGVGICGGCQMATLFFFNILNDQGYLASASKVSQISGNVRNYGLLRIRQLGQTPGPNKPNIPDHLPSNVDRAFSDAEKSYLSGHWNQAAASYRKTVDRAISLFVGEDEALKKINRPMLGQKLGALERGEELPPAMIKWIKLVKDDGNFALHDEDQDFNKEEEVKPTRLFTRTLLEYLFTLPKTIELATETENDD